MRPAHAITLVITAALLTATAAAVSTTQAVKSSNTVTITLDDSVAMLYKYADVPYKPYVKQLYSPKGVPILLDAPADHLHHHALMYAITVDGVNFWEEANAPGVEKSVSVGCFGVSQSVDGRELALGGLDERLYWLNPRTSERYLEEERHIEVATGLARGATILTWRSQFTLPEGKASAKLTGSHYQGLGMRFVRSMDARGPFFNPDHLEGTVYRGSERLLRSRWCAYRSSVDGKTVTVAMFDHPDNPRHPATWFIMDKPFAYMSATLNLHEDPLEMTAGKLLTLTYGVAVFDGAADEKAVQKAWQLWLKQLETKDHKGG